MARRGTDIRAVVALPDPHDHGSIISDSDAPSGCAGNAVVPVVDTLQFYTPANGGPSRPVLSFSKTGILSRNGDRLSRTSNRRDIYGGHAMFRAGASVRLMGWSLMAMGQPGNFGRIGATRSTSI